MPKNNYGPNPGPGFVRNRIWRVSGENPNPSEVKNSTPSMTFHEERAVMLSDGKSEECLGKTRNILSVFTPGKMVQLRYPDSDALIPGAFMSHEQIYAAIYALARQAQNEEDDKEAAAEAEAQRRADEIANAG